MEEFKQENSARAGYTPAFPLMSTENLVHLGEELGLSMSKYQLSLLQNKFWKQSDRYTFDEIYAADAYLKEFHTYYSDILIHSAEIENEQIGEAFSDLINKYTALGRNGAPSLDELPSVYNTYLSALNFAPSKEKVKVIPTSLLLDSKELFSEKVTNILSRASHSPFALAQTKGHYRFNTKKEKMSGGKTGTDPINLICVMLPEEEFAYKSLCEKIDSSPHMSADVLLALPVGKGGIWHTLGGCGCSYMLDNESLSSLFEKEIRPVTLTEPSSTVLLFSCRDTVAPMLNALQKWGYTASAIGSAITQDDYISIPYGGAVHTVSYEALSYAALPKALSLNIPSDTNAQSNANISKENGVTCLSFERLGFDALSAHLEDIMNGMTNEKGKNRLSVAFALPIDVSEGAEHTSVSERLCEFLAIYRSCAKRAVPIAAHTFPRTDKAENAAVWVWDESTYFEG